MDAPATRGRVVRRGRSWMASTHLYELIHYVRFMSICDLADVWCPPTSYGVHTLLCLGLYSSPPPPPPSTCAVVLRNPLPTKRYYSIGMTSIYIQCVGVFIFLRLGT